MSDVWVLIPTGNRPESALSVVKAWAEYKQHGIKIALCVWDEVTYRAVEPYADWIKFSFRQPFSVFQNHMMSNVKGEWSGVVCAADDLYPLDNCERLPECCETNDGKALFIYDSVNNDIPCHPVITRKFYEEHGPEIFDEGFVHNFCDTDLWRRHKRNFVRVNDILFEHKHYTVSKRKRDDIDAIAANSWHKDQEYFNLNHKN
jgi:hypothetical protein